MIRRWRRRSLAGDHRAALIALFVFNLIYCTMMPLTQVFLVYLLYWPAYAYRPPAKTDNIGGGHRAWLDNSLGQQLVTSQTKAATINLF